MKPAQAFCVGREPSDFTQLTHAAAAVSATHADWSREAKAFWSWNPSRSLLASLRAYERARSSNLPLGVLRRRLAVLRHRFWSVVTGAEVPLGCQIGGGLLLPHPNGVIIHPKTRIGPNCLIFQQVTLGVGGSHAGVPLVGGHVDIGAGAKLLGGITLGDHSRIGANAVVLRDVPAGHTAVGIPARVKTVDILLTEVSEPSLVSRTLDTVS